MIYLDTNALLWIAGAPDPALPSAIEAVNAAEALHVSPMVELEVEYLYEIGRIRRDAAAVMSPSCRRHSLARLRPSLFSRGAGRARDFDRLITAQAAIGDDTLLTRDATIRAHYPRALW
ncbi:MAG: PIN domain-containing protein [Proteobacteria bacterium]|nr:PIN domain-containing protein [Pseudomonadota bacterium]